MEDELDVVARRTARGHGPCEHDERVRVHRPDAAGIPEPERPGTRRCEGGRRRADLDGVVHHGKRTRRTDPAAEFLAKEVGNDQPPGVRLEQPARGLARRPRDPPHVILLHPVVHHPRCGRNAEVGRPARAECERRRRCRHHEQHLGVEAREYGALKRLPRHGLGVQVADQRSQPSGHAAGQPPPGVVNPVAVGIGRGLAGRGRDHPHGISGPARQEVEERSAGATARRREIRVRDDEQSRRSVAHPARTLHASTISSKIVPSGTVMSQPG